MRKYKKTIKVCYATDFKYFEYTLTSVYSLFIHRFNQDEDLNYIVYIISVDIDNNYLKILDKFNRNNFKIKIINLDKNNLIFKNYYGKYSQHVNNTVFIKLILQDILRNEKGRIIFLDSDTIVKENLLNLYEVKPSAENKFIFGCPDIGICTNMNGLSEWAEIDYIRKKFDYANNINYTNKLIYINAGVLLFDLDLARKNNFSEKCFEYYQSDEYKKFMFADQDIINLFFYPNIEYLNVKYNIQLQALFETIPNLNKIYKRNFADYINVYNQKLYNNAQEMISDAKIIHYTGNKNNLYLNKNFINIYEQVYLASKRFLMK